MAINKTNGILVIYKRSAFSVAGRHSQKLRRSVIFRANHRQHFKTLDKIKNVLASLGIPYQCKTRNSKINYQEYGLVITVGGDGTLLEAARKMRPNQLLLGVNSDPEWSVGKFCHADSRNFQRIIKNAVSGSSRIRHLHKLRIGLRKGGTTIRIECLNDVLICHANPAAMSRYRITLGNISEEHRSSGIWIASAAGSSGAILSAGGQQLPEQSRSIQYRPRELYCVRNLSYRLKGGLISGREATIKSLMLRGRIFVDGSHIEYPFPYGSQAVISSSPNFVSLIHA